VKRGLQNLFEKHFGKGKEKAKGKSVLTKFEIEAGVERESKGKEKAKGKKERERQITSFPNPRKIFNSFINQEGRRVLYHYFLLLFLLPFL